MTFSMKRPAAMWSMALAAMVALPALAQDQDEPPRLVPQATTAAQQWQVFSSPEAGIELSMPPGKLAPSDEPNILALVLDTERNWRFEVRRLPLERPMSLVAQEMAEGGRRAGLLEMLAASAQQNLQGDILRQALTPLPDADAGVYVIRYSMGPATQLQQVAVIQASDVLFYQITLTTPAPSGPVEQLESDAGVREAAEGFKKSLDSFKVLDQTELRREQEDRLFRTRSLLVNITKPRLMEALVPEQWLRIRRGGQDIGYSYLVEEPAREIPADPVQREQVDSHGARGIRIGMRTRLRRDSGWLDRETWFYAADDLREEEFRERNQMLVDGEKSAEYLVIGRMRARQMPQAVVVPKAGGLGTEKGFTVSDSRKLDVTYVADGVQAGAPLNRQLPAWYIPQGVEHLLPRLVAPWGRNTYLVAVYNPEKREIYQQYVDVEGLRNETVRGQQRLVMLVTTRTGLSGSKTRHLIDPDTYRWLGSENPDEGLEIWPSDAATLQEIWGDPDLSVPDPRERGDEQP